MLSRSVELSDVVSPKAPTWRASCRCFTTDDLPRGTRGSIFGLQCMQNSTVNARDSRFILVQTLDHDRVIALCPVGVSLCVELIVKCCVALSLLLPPSKEPCPPLYSQEARVLVGLQCRVLVGLQDSITTRITWEES